MSTSLATVDIAIADKYQKIAQMQREIEELQNPIELQQRHTHYISHKQ